MVLRVMFQSQRTIPQETTRIKSGSTGVQLGNRLGQGRDFVSHSL
jgi:hypothetical protein